MEADDDIVIMDEITRPGRAPSPPVDQFGRVAREGVPDEPLGPAVGPARPRQAKKLLGPRVQPPPPPPPHPMAQFKLKPAEHFSLPGAGVGGTGLGGTVGGPGPWAPGPGTTVGGPIMGGPNPWAPNTGLPWHGHLNFASLNIK